MRMNHLSISIRPANNKFQSNIVIISPRRRPSILIHTQMDKTKPLIISFSFIVCFISPKTFGLFTPEKPRLSPTLWEKNQQFSLLLYYQFWIIFKTEIIWCMIAALGCCFARCEYKKFLSSSGLMFPSCFKENEKK